MPIGRKNVSDVKKKNPYNTDGEEVSGYANDCYCLQILKLQKKTVRIIASTLRDHTALLSESLEILP